MGILWVEVVKVYKAIYHQNVWNNLSTKSNTTEYHHICGIWETLPKSLLSQNAASETIRAENEC